MWIEEQSVELVARSTVTQETIQRQLNIKYHIGKIRAVDHRPQVLDILAAMDVLRVVVTEKRRTVHNQMCPDVPVAFRF